MLARCGTSGRAGPTAWPEQWLHRSDHLRGGRARGPPGSGGALLAVRDSKDVERPPLRFSATAWTTFVAGLEPDRFS
ncbi:hypothetical protein SMICM304S_00463 [Streptomyces microflavus]